MNEPRAFCPGCKKEVSFVRTGQLATCPECGFQYGLSAVTPPPLPGRKRSAVAKIFGLLLIVFLIMVGLVLVGVAVLFAGCAMVVGR